MTLIRSLALGVTAFALSALALAAHPTLLG